MASKKTILKQGQKLEGWEGASPYKMKIVLKARTHPVRGQDLAATPLKETRIRR